MAHALYISESTRWLAVSRRDPLADSSFFYGALSTRIFCRPSCPGRVARRANVVFFNDQRQAIQSGYRPCKRCQPCCETWSRGNEGRMLAYRLRDLILAAEKNETQWTVEAFARKLGISTAHLHREFKKHCGLTPKSFRASIKRDAHLIPSFYSSGVQSDERQPRDVFDQNGIGSNPAPQHKEQQVNNATLEPTFCGDTGYELCLNEDPPPAFLEILALEEFLHFEDS